MEKSENQTIVKIKTFLSNRYNLLFSAGFIILVIIIISMAVFISTDSSKKTARISPTPIPTSTAIQQQSQPTIQAQITITTRERTEIETQARPQLNNVIEISYGVGNMKKYTGDWAIMQVTNPDTDTGLVVVKKENNQWVVKAGPGTSFDPEELRSLGAPEELITDANKGI